jgi:hypothetical protein
MVLCESSMKNTHLVSATFLAIFALAACGPNAEERCADLKAAECPPGHTNLEEEEASCKSKYDGECSDEWDAYVTCAIDEPNCGVEVTSCFRSEFHDYASCECEYEGTGSPWCGL